MNPLQNLIDALSHENVWREGPTLSRNEFLKQGESIDTNLYYVNSGSLRIFVIDEYEEHTIRFGYSGDLIAALDSFLSEKKSDLNIQALKKTELKTLSKKDFRKYLNSSEQGVDLWTKVLESFALQQMERERDILTTSPIERYKRVLMRSPRLFQEVPNKYIASYLRMTPETLSRIKKS